MRKWWGDPSLGSQGHWFWRGWVCCHWQWTLEVCWAKLAVAVMEVVETHGIPDRSPRAICTRRRCGGDGGSQGNVPAVHFDAQVATWAPKVTVGPAVCNTTTSGPECPPTFVRRAAGNCRDVFTGLGTMVVQVTDSIPTIPKQHYKSTKKTNRDEPVASAQPQHAETWKDHKIDRDPQRTLQR